MAYQDNSTSYSFGQMGSVFVVSDVGPVTSDSSGLDAANDPIPVGAVFVAITFIEDTEFDGSNGLVAENVKRYPSTEGGSLGISSSGSAIDSVVFPAGVTIYGRWTEIDLTSGKLIAYVGY